VNRNSLAIFGAILWIGLVAGTLDITENLVFSQLRAVTPWRVFQYIASGLIGSQAFQSGWASVLLGVALHYIIALIWTALFYLIAREFPLIMRRPVLSGLLYGGVVYVIMNFIVVPLSGVPHPLRPITLVSRINAVLALLLCIGLPISLLMRRTLFQVRN
jgi:uncharacterized membrane protein YagU involved in acid resistance